MSIKLMTAVWETAIGPATRRLVLLALADIANDDGEAWPRIDTLARRANCSRTTAEDSLRSLAADQIIDRESRGFNRSNMYRINTDCLTPGFRGSPKTPGSTGDDPRNPGGGTPENPGTEPSVEPPTEPLKPSSSATPDGVTDKIAGEDHDLLGEPAAAAKAKGSTRPRTGSGSSTTGVVRDPGSSETSSARRGDQLGDRDDVDQLCQRLRDRIVANGSKPPPITQAWRTAARLLLDADSRDLTKALNLIDWCQANGFWQSKILSMPKFRTQYDQLRLTALEEHRRSNGNGRSGDTRSNGFVKHRNPEDQSVYDVDPFKLAAEEQAARVKGATV